MNLQAEAGGITLAKVMCQSASCPKIRPQRKDSIFGCDFAWAGPLDSRFLTWKPSEWASGGMLLRFCTSTGPLSLAIPTTQRWTLWAMASSEALGGSAASLTVESPCAAPSNVAYASITSCREGALVESGGTCSSACLAGNAQVLNSDLISLLAWK